jgi:hypothetical protein
MSALWTKEAIIQAQEAHHAFVGGGELIALYLVVGSIIPIALLGWIRKDPIYIGIWLTILIATIFACDPVLVLLTYFSPPSWLTLGHKIGGFAPTSCETSKLIWGPRAWPCQALEFQIWLGNVAGPDGWSCLIRPEPAWLVYLFLFLMWLFMMIAFYLLPARIVQLAEEETQQKELDAQERQQDIERGIACGIEEWKASAEGYIILGTHPDEKSKLH